MSAMLPRLTFSMMAAKRPFSIRLPPTTLSPRTAADDKLDILVCLRLPIAAATPAADICLAKIMRPIIFVPSLLGCHVTG